jgi:hypothetical protein
VALVLPEALAEQHEISTMGKGPSKLKPQQLDELLECTYCMWFHRNPVAILFFLSSSSEIGSSLPMCSPFTFCLAVDRKELQLWYKGFAKDCPSGLLNKEDFIKIYKQVRPRHAFTTKPGFGGEEMDVARPFLRSFSLWATQPSLRGTYFTCSTRTGMATSTLRSSFAACPLRRAAMSTRS